MHAYYLALAVALAAPTLAAPSPDRFGHEREIDPIAPDHLNYVLNDARLTAQKNRGNLITKPRVEQLVDNVILESQVLQVRPRRLGQASGEEVVRRRRGYNLENVRVPARYPYLPVANFNRFRRWG